MSLFMDNHKKHSLGRRAFLVFLSRRIPFVIFAFAIPAAIWYGERWLPQSYFIWEDYAAKLLLLLAAAYFLFVLLQTYLAYRFYTYTFTDEAFIMTSGYITRSEVAALYHQIQNVNVRRTPLDRLIGVSQITIIMNGTDRDAPHNKIVLPSVGRKKARLVQKELLVRARRHVVSGGDLESRIQNPESRN